MASSLSLQRALDSIDEYPVDFTIAVIFLRSSRMHSVIYEGSPPREHMNVSITRIGNSSNVTVARQRHESSVLQRPLFRPPEISIAASDVEKFEAEL